MQVLTHKDEKELQAIAAEVSKSITIRSYYINGANGEQIPVDSTRGNSRDDTREATAEEAAIIFNIIYAALLSTNWNRRHPETFQAIRDTAEFTGQLFFKEFDFEVNCYDTIAIPLYKITAEWKKEE